MKRHTSLDDRESPLRAYLIPLHGPHEDEIETHVGSGDEEFSLGLNVSLQETQIDHHEEENPSERSQNRSSFLSSSFVFENYEPSLDSDELAPEKARLKAVEESWRNMVRWTYLSRLGYRSLYFLFLKQSASSPEPETENLELSPLDPTGSSEPSSSVTLSASMLPPEPSERSDSSEEEPQLLIAETDARPVLEDSAETLHSSSSHLWLHGRSFPLEGKDLWRVLALNVAIEETEKVLIEGIHTLFAILVVSQVFYSIKNHTDFAQIFNIIFKSGDGNSIRDLYQLGNPVPHAQGLWGLLAFPFAWGTFKGLKTYHYHEKEDLQHAIEKLEHLPVGFYHDNIRWFLPCLAVEHAFHELTEALLFEKVLPSAEKRNILRGLDVFAQKHGGRSRMFAYHTFYNVADGVSIRNFSALPENTQEELLQEKALALQCLMKGAHQPHKSLSNAIPAFYARYLLWTLGQSKGLAENVFFLGLRTAKTALTVLLFKTIIQGIIDILNCPQQQGQTWTGPATWSSDYTYTCFQAYMRNFNTIPDQPASTFINLLPQFHLPSIIDWDFSSRGITNGTVIAQIIEAFVQYQPGVTIRSLDLSNNEIVHPDEIGAILKALPISLQTLIWANNNYNRQNADISIGGWGESSLRLLSRLTYLTTLDLSANTIAPSASGDELSMEGLSYAFQYLTALIFLDLSNNNIDYLNSTGATLLGNGLKFLTSLQHLNLSYNMIGLGSNSEGTRAIGKSLSSLSQLHSLDLSNNWIGIHDSKGTKDIGESLLSLTQLRYLDLAHNAIGNKDFNGIETLAENLQYILHLQYFNIINNNLNGYLDAATLSSFSSSLCQLQEISSLFIIQQRFSGYLSYNFSLTLQDCLTLSPSQTDLYLLQTPTAMQEYLDSLPTTLQSLNLSHKFSPTLAILNVIAENFRNFTSLLFLDLSNNNFGCLDFSVLGEGFYALSSLQGLDLSNNNIDYKLFPQAITSLAIGLRSLTGLRKLNLSYNSIGAWNSNTTKIIAESLQYLTQLQHLDLSRNYIEFIDSLGTKTLGEILPYLTQLQYFDLSNNYIGDLDSRGSRSLGEGIAGLTELQYLDLSHNYIDYLDSSATQALGKSLRFLGKLSFLNLAYNPIGNIDSKGTEALGNAFQYLRGLRYFNLNNNYIGTQDSNGTLAIAAGIRDLTLLQYLNLAYNNIGSTGPEGPAAILSAFPMLLRESLETFDIGGMTNVFWTQQESALEFFINKNLIAACESQLCHGGSVSQPTVPHRTRSLVSSDQILSENTPPKEKLSRASKSSQKSLPQPEPDQSLDSLEEESFVTSSASSLQPPLVLTFIPHLLSKLSHTVSDWWNTPSPSLSLSPVQEPLLEASVPSSSSSYSFSGKASSQQSFFSAPCEGVKLTSFNACQAGTASSVGSNFCEAQPPVFNACVVKPSIIAPSLDSIFLLGSFFWRAFINPERQEKAIDWTVPFSEHLKSHIDHKLNRISDILQARSSKISPDTLKSYAWSLEDLNNIFAKHYDHSTILLSKLMSFQDELDYLFLQLTRFERNSEKHKVEKKFYDGILGCYKDLKALPPLLSVLKEKLSEEDFAQYEKDFQRFVEILFDFEMKGKRAKTNKWMKRFKKNLSAFTCEITEEVGKVSLSTSSS